MGFAGFWFLTRATAAKLYLYFACPQRVKIISLKAHWPGSSVWRDPGCFLPALSDPFANLAVNGFLRDLAEALRPLRSKAPDLGLAAFSFCWHDAHHRLRSLEEQKE
jgi:hypothetical protein